MAPNAPLPRSNPSANPSSCTRYPDAGESGPGPLPLQPSTVSRMRPILPAIRHLRVPERDVHVSGVCSVRRGGLDQRSEEAARQPVERLDVAGGKENVPGRRLLG